MIKCAVFGCWNMAPNKTGLCADHRDSRLKREAPRREAGSARKGESGGAGTAIAQPFQSLPPGES